MFLTLMLSLLLGIHVSIDNMDKKPIQAMSADFSSNWPIRSREPMAAGQTSVIPRGLDRGRVPDKPRPRHLKGSGALDRGPAINAGINLITLYSDKSSSLDFHEPKALERV